MCHLRGGAVCLLQWRASAVRVIPARHRHAQSQCRNQCACSCKANRLHSLAEAGGRRYGKKPTNHCTVPKTAMSTMDNQTNIASSTTLNQHHYTHHQPLDPNHQAKNHPPTIHPIPPCQRSQDQRPYCASVGISAILSIVCPYGTSVTGTSGLVLFTGLIGGSAALSCFIGHSICRAQAAIRTVGCSGSPGVRGGWCG